MPEDRPLIHIRIRDLRRGQSLTQEELATALGVSRQSINAMEAGRCLPSLPVAMQIASFFSVPLNLIFEVAESATENLNNQLNMANSNPLLPWSPLQEMREALDGLIDDSKIRPQNQIFSSPEVNIYQNKESVMVELALPGFAPDEIGLEVGDDFLVVEGTPKNDSNVEYFRQEFGIEYFKRTIGLPALVVTDSAQAEMKQGILRVKISKIIEEKPKTTKISIKELE